MPVFQTKPFTVEAIQLIGFDSDGSPRFTTETPQWLLAAMKLSNVGLGSMWLDGCGKLRIISSGGPQEIMPGDWVIRDPGGNLHCCDNQTFNSNYEDFKPAAGGSAPGSAPRS